MVLSIVVSCFAVGCEETVVRVFDTGIGET